MIEKGDRVVVLKYQCSNPATGCVQHESCVGRDGIAETCGPDWVRVRFADDNKCCTYPPKCLKKWVDHI